MAFLSCRIGIIGRKRVVNFLVKAVAKLIRRFVGRRAARPLSRALVDAGLKLVNLETPDEAEDAASDMLVATVEEIVERLVAEAPGDAFDDEALLDVYTQEAFEASAAANFLPSLLRPEMREASVKTGAWVLRPVGRGKKAYKNLSATLSLRRAHRRLR